MTKVTAQMSVSLDGCYAGPRVDGGADWMDSAEAAGFEAEGLEKVLAGVSNRHECVRGERERRPSGLPVS